MFTRRGPDHKANQPEPEVVAVQKAELDRLIEHTKYLERSNAALLEALTTALDSHTNGGVVIDRRAIDREVVVTFTAISQDGSRVWCARHRLGENPPPPPPGAGLIINPSGHIILPS